MALFSKLDKPIFLKEESELKYYITKLKELYSKSSGDLREKLEREIKIASLGEIGENNIAFELKNSNIPMYVLHDINIEIDGLSAQIDYIVVTRKVTYIIECKNLVGNIEIDSQGNFIRTYNFNGRFIKEGIYSPITQNQRHLDLIKRLGKANKSNIVTRMLFEKYFDDNYKSIVVLANPKTLLNYKYAKKEVRDKVIKVDQLVNFIKETNAKSSLASLDDNNLKKIAERIISYYRSDKMSYLKKYQSFLDEYEFSQSYVNKGDNKAIVESNKISINKEELIKKLKDFRLEMSRAEKIKPYFIYNDKQMMNLIENMPKTKEELKNIYGFGEVKINKYGDNILKIINK